MRGVLVGALLAGCSFELTPSASPIVDAPAPSFRDCRDAFERGGVTTDGTIMIDPDGASTGAAPFTAYCDMTTHGGGWTLVYAYTFTNYADFNAGSNAATPRPTWPLTTLDPSTVPMSTTVPVAPDQLGALDFTRWSSLGDDFLVTSNVNHWLACRPAGGSLDAATAGPVTCEIVKVVGTACTTAVPSRLEWFDRGPTLLMPGSSQHYYYWEASLLGSWPTHDPCGANAENQLMGIVNPGGAIFPPAPVGIGSGSLGRPPLPPTATGDTSR